MLIYVLIQQAQNLEEIRGVNMNKTTKILIVMAIMVFVLSPLVSAVRMNEQLFQLGNAERTYQDGRITCYLGHLFPGQPIYWCMMPDGGMDHSWFVYQVQDMERYYTGGVSETYTPTPKGRLN